MAVFFDCQFLEMFLHVFLQYWKLDRTDFKKILVKSFWIKVVAEYSLPFCLQIKKTEVSPAVFQIIGGRFHDILVDLRYCICICDSKKFQQSGGFVLTPAIIMDAFLFISTAILIYNRKNAARKIFHDISCDIPPTTAPIDNWKHTDIHKILYKLPSLRCSRWR